VSGRQAVDSWRRATFGFLVALALVGLAAAQEPEALRRARELNDQAFDVFRGGRYPEALAKAREALALREQALGPSHPDVAVSLNNIAFILKAMGDNAGARSHFDRAINIAEKAFGPNHPEVALKLNNLGAFLEDTGQHVAARAVFERVLRIHEQALGPNHLDVANDLNNLGKLLYNTGDYAGARPYFERALRIRESASSATHPDVLTSLNNLGSTLGKLGEYAAARPLLERAAQMRERALGPNHPDVAVNLSNLATLLEETGDYAAARPLRERALRITEAVYGPVHPEVAANLRRLAGLLARTGNYAQARPLYERSLRISEQALGPMHPEVAKVLNGYALFLEIVGDYAAARPLYERALRIDEQTLGPNHPELATVLANLAALLRQTGDPAAARPVYERALRIREQAFGPFHPDVAQSVNSLAVLQQSTGDLMGARALYERALGIAERNFGPAHPYVAIALGNLADVLIGLGRHAEARPMAERALAIARRSGEPELLGRMLTRVGELRERDGRLTDAVTFYREAVAAVNRLAGQFTDSAGRTRYLQAENRLAVYDALARVLLQLHQQQPTKGYDREAVAVLEAKKGRIVGEALTATRPILQEPQARQAAGKVWAQQDQVVAIEKLLREEQAKPPQAQSPETLQNLTTLLAQNKGAYQAEVQAFLQRYPRLKTQFVDQQTVDPQALAKFAARLPAGTLAVQYFAAEDALYLFVAGPDDLYQVKRQAVSQEELYRRVYEYRQAIDRAKEQYLKGQPLPWADDGSFLYRREVAPLKELAQKLAAHLLGPIEPELRTHRSLVLIPSDLLLYLPIHALTRPAPDGTSRFLAETHRVSYLTQLELADLLAARPPVPNAPLLALAPTADLGGADEEVRALQRIRPGVTVLEGAQATKAAFVGLAGRFPVLHLATHAVFDAHRPEHSYIRLAGPDAISQRLEIPEIAGLSLPQNELVILSACETALGEQRPGAALMTLAAAFSQAGSRAIVASLWEVSDQATRDFMVTFHRALPTAGRVGALQEAQRTLLQQSPTAHPYYWAAFILLGAR